MRLIDADALVKYFEGLAVSLANVECFDAADATQTAAETLKLAPTIDAEPVVRCKDCQHWGTGYGGETDNIKVCEYANYMVGKNGYCVYGERKMDLEV